MDTEIEYGRARPMYPMPLRRGRMIIYCTSCKKYFVVRDEQGFKGDCTECGAYASVMRCCRCGHKWIPRIVLGLPARCPGCNSPYWNRERTNKQDKRGL